MRDKMFFFIKSTIFYTLAFSNRSFIDEATKYL